MLLSSRQAAHFFKNIGYILIVAFNAEALSRAILAVFVVLKSQPRQSWPHSSECCLSGIWSGNYVCSWFKPSQQPGLVHFKDAKNPEDILQALERGGKYNCWTAATRELFLTSFTEDYFKATTSTYEGLEGGQISGRVLKAFRFAARVCTRQLKSESLGGDGSRKSWVHAAFLKCFLNCKAKHNLGLMGKGERDKGGRLPKSRAVSWITRRSIWLGMNEATGPET